MKALLSPSRKYMAALVCAWLGIAMPHDVQAQLSIGLTATEYHGGQFHVSEQGAADGGITSAVSGGVEPYSYAWKRLDGAMGYMAMGTTQHLSGVGGGQYRLTVMDSTGLVDSASVFLTEPVPLMVMPQVTHLTCVNMTNGSATLMVTGGASPYTYLWSNGDTLSSTAGLGAGQHHVTVTSAGGAERTEYFNVNAPMAMGVHIMQMTWAQCGGDTVTLSAGAWGGTPPYSYHWSTGAFSSTVSVTNGGQHSVQVTDMHNCHATDSIFVSMPQALTATINYLPYPNGTPFSCDTCNDGVIQVTPSGGMVPYSVMWSTAHNGTVLHGMHADSAYHVTVHDMMGCTWRSDTLIAERGVAFEQQLGVFVFAHQYAGGHHMSHAGAMDGSMEAVVVGGTPPYALLWSTGDTVAELTGLGPGYYTVTVTDQVGVQRTRSKNLTAPMPLSVSLTGGLGGCMAMGNQLNAFVNGGAPPYTYIWHRNDSVYDSTHNYPYLYLQNAGTYRVEVADANADTVSMQLVIAESVPLTADVTATEVQPGYHATCYGDTVQLSLAVSGGNGMYMFMWEHGSFNQNPIVTSGGWKVVRVNDMQGCMVEDSIYVNMPVKLENKIHPFIYANGQTFSCDTCNDGKFILDSIWGGMPPYAHQWSDGSTVDTLHGIFQDIVYSITITDALGCSTTESGSMSRNQVPPAPAISMWHEKSNYPGGYHVSCAGCMDGWIQLWPSGGHWPYTFQWSDGDTAQHRYGLMAGSYSVMVTDVYGLVLHRQFTLLGPGGGLSVSLSSQVPGCQSAEGHVYAHMNGGTPPYSYQWSRNDSLFDGTYQFSHLTIWQGGNYKVRVTDANTDTVTSQIHVGTAQTMSTALTATEVQPGYHATCDGDTVQLTLTVSGGSGPYMFMWEHGSFQQSPKVTRNGWKVVRVNDMMGCTAVDSIHINMPSKLENKIHPHVYPNGQAFSCDTCNDGMFVIDSIFGGVGPYSHVWSNGSTGDTLHGIIPDTLYSITMTDALGCTLTDSGSLPREWNPEPQGLMLTHERSYYPGGYNVSCAACMDGWIHLSITGGTPPYTYQWMDSVNTQNRYTLMAGTYSVMVTDAHGLGVWREFTLLGPGSLLSVSLSSQTPGCNSAEGHVYAHVNGGTPPYAYQWSRNDSLYDPTYQFSHLSIWAGGNYKVWVTDANADTVTSQIPVGTAQPMTTALTATEVQPGYHAQCHGDTVQLSLTMSGGMEPYSYMWEHGSFQKNPKVTNGGWKVVRVNDMMGCQREDSIYVNMPAELNTPDMMPHVYENGKFFSCDTCSDGIIRLPGVLGGVPPYSILWSDGSTGDSLVGIAIDSVISITVTDALGCVFYEEGSLPWEWVEEISVNDNRSHFPGGYNVSCHGCTDGWIELYVNGGMPPYTFAWNDGGSTQIRHGLQVGSYNVTVTDAQGNTGQHHVELLGPGGGLSVHINNNSTSCRGMVNGSLYASVMGGVPPYTYQWRRDGMVMPDMRDYMNVWQNGGYHVRVTDMNGQTATDSVQVGSGAELTITAEGVEKYGNAHTGCTVADGELVLHLSGGTPPYNVNLHSRTERLSNSYPATATPATAMGFYRWLSTMDTVAVLDSLPAGHYNINVNDMSGCNAMSDFELRAPGGYVVTSTPVELPNGQYASCDTCADVTVNAAALGGWGEVQYAWVEIPAEHTPIRLRGASLSISERPDGLDASLFDGTDPSVFGTGVQQTGLSTETMYMVATMDELGCMGQAMFTVERPKAEVAALSGWGLYGNDGNGNQLAGEGEPWLGTGDSTDVVMKANGVPQLRLGANGVTEVMGQFKLKGLASLTEYPCEQQLLMTSDGTVTVAFNPCPPPECVAIKPWSKPPNGSLTDVALCNAFQNVGIGYLNPTHRLHVSGNGYFTTDLGIGKAADENIRLLVKPSISPGKTGIHIEGRDINPALSVTHQSDDPYLRIFGNGRLEIIGNEQGAENAPMAMLNITDLNGDAALRVFNTGNVLIGRPNTGQHSDAKLMVNGKLLATEVFVTIDHWSDFVFDKDYRLRPLSEVQAHIAEHGHLPDVPSAKEVIGKGNNLGEMDAILLQKIEELTLYMLQMDQRMKELEEENRRLRKNDDLRRTISD